MPDRFVGAFIDKLILLEQKVGHKVQYRVMPPLTAPFHDPLSVQAVAKQIAEFIGLTGFTFIVAAAKQKEHVGGHKDLSTSGGEVFVEVDSDLLRFPDAVAATLCHEICHKYLQVNGLGAALEIENEILTDMTAVFLGFGKIMLNGCRTAHVRHEPLADGTQTVTETMTAGYLDRDQLAFVYRVVCAMRSIPPPDLMVGLNAEAALAVQRCDSSYGRHYGPGFHRIEAAQEIVAAFSMRAIDAQRTMADLNKHATYVRRSLCDTVGKLFIDGHRKLESLRQESAAMAENNDPDPALRFLRAVQSDCEAGRLIGEVHCVSKEAEGMLQHLQVVGLHLSRNTRQFPPPCPAMFTTVTCPKDGTKLHLPKSSGDLIAICPICKFQFAYNTSPLSFAGPEPHRLKWWERIRNPMKRRQSA